jgi:hypothetical protein
MQRYNICGWRISLYGGYLGKEGVYIRRIYGERVYLRLRSGGLCPADTPYSPRFFM